MLSLQTHTDRTGFHLKHSFRGIVTFQLPKTLRFTHIWTVDKLQERKRYRSARCCKRGAFSHLRQGHVEKWGRTRDTHRKTGVNGKEMDKKGRRERTGRKLWERTEDKWRQGHKAGVTRKGNAKSKSQAETSLETNSFNRVATAAAVDTWLNEASDGLKLTWANAGKAEVSDGAPTGWEWSGTSGRCQNVTFHWAGGRVLSQKADLNISHEYLPGSNSSFKKSRKEAI